MAHEELKDVPLGTSVDLVVQLTTGGDGIDVVIAPAGTGKTFALDAARDAWQRGGYHVIGASLAARAAAELESTAGIPHPHLLTGSTTPPTAASYQPAACSWSVKPARTRTSLASSTTPAAADTKVVLVGDPRQLPEIDAGGLSAASAVTRPDPTQQTGASTNPGARRAPALRDGEIDTADAYEARPHHLRADREPDRQTMVADWGRPGSPATARSWSRLVGTTSTTSTPGPSTSSTACSRAP